MEEEYKKFLIQQTPVYPGGYVVVLKDFKYWATAYNDLLDYCNERRVSCDGLIIVLPNKEEAVLFKLRWT